MSDSLHLYGHPLSQPSRSVEIFLRLSGINFEFHLVDLFNGQELTEEFTRVNPSQQVPAIVHGEFNLWESAAIIPYIADAFNIDNQWYPKDIKIRARINAYLHWHHQGVREAIGEYPFFTDMGPKLFGLPELTPEAKVAITAKYNEGYANLKWILSDTGYIGRTSEATIADVFAYSEVSNTLIIKETLSDFPEVKAWYDKIGANEIISQVHQNIRDYAVSYNP